MRLIYLFEFSLKNLVITPKTGMFPANSKEMALGFYILILFH